MAPVTTFASFAKVCFYPHLRGLLTLHGFQDILCVLHGRVHISELIAFQSWTRSHFIESTRFERYYHLSQRCYVSPCVSVRFPLFSFVDYVLRALLAPRVQLLLRHTPQLPLLSRWCPLDISLV